MGATEIRIPISSYLNWFCLLAVPYLQADAAAALVIVVNGEARTAWHKRHGMDYDGMAWYRTTFVVKRDAKHRRCRLIFGAVDEACIVWVNGKRVLERPYPYKGNTDSWQEAFEVDISEVVRFDRPNVVAVRVEDNVGAGGIWRRVWLDVSEAPGQ